MKKSHWRFRQDDELASGRKALVQNGRGWIVGEEMELYEVGSAQKAEAVCGKNRT